MKIIALVASVAALALPTEILGAEAAAAATAVEAEKPPGELRLNFRGVPIEMVLDYLSEAAGYTILLETQVKGTVDVWSNRPLSKEEGLEVLNAVLNKNGYAAIVNGKTLSIVTKEEAVKRNVPVRSGNDPQSIPKSEEIVTQVIPVLNIQAAKLLENLKPLLPASASMSSNEDGNALMITDTQINIRRMAEIIAALDTTVSSASTLKVFALKYADAKQLATTLTTLFQESGGGSNNRNGRGGGGFPFPGMFGGRGGGGGGGEQSPESAVIQAASRVVAVADEHSNSLIVAASTTQMASIDALVAEVDTDVQDLTELRVFPLKFADPEEMATLLGNLFPDTSSSNQQRGGGFRFGGGPFGPGGPFGGGGRGGNNAATGADSERMKSQSKVIAVADARTSSVVVSAAKELMPQIREIVTQLDANPARKQKVFVYSLENANVTEVQTVLRDLFESQNSRNSSSTLNQNNALQNRANNAAQQNNNQTGGGFGQGGGGGGFGGGGR